MVNNFFELRTVTWSNGSVRMIDQTLLPQRLVYRSFKRWQDIADAIRRMVVRGAPAIGVAAAMGVVLAAYYSKARTKAGIIHDMEIAAKVLRQTRPTAVNLFWGIERIMERAKQGPDNVGELREYLVEEVKAMEEEDIKLNKAISKLGSELIEDGDTILTQCNAGALATVGYGTALGIIRAAREQGKFVKVIVPETRPALQGSRLTAFELSIDKIDCTIIPDTAIGYMISIGRVNKVLVGADRITRDCYVFNKIGTYQIAVLSNRHRIPFYVAAPYPSFDMRRTHDQVIIEERPFDEVIKIRGRRIAPKGVPVANPAFDMTPPELVTAIISDKGIIYQPLTENITKVL